MDYQKCGKFLTDLRKKKGLTQQDLAEKINYSDKTISRWERGDSFPTDIAVLKSLSKELNVSIEELMYGGRKTKENSKNVDNIIVKEYEKQHSSLKKSKLKNKIFLLVFILILISSIFSVLYFGFYRNSIKIYKLTIDDTEGILKNNSFILIETKDKAFLNFSKLETINNEIIDYIHFYYIDDEKENDIISFSNDNMLLSELSGYSEYNLDKIDISNLHIEISINSIKYDWKINKELIYSNTNLFPEKEEFIGADKNKIVEKNNEDYTSFLLDNGFHEEVPNIFKIEKDEEVIEVSLETKSISIIVDRGDLSFNILASAIDDNINVINYNSNIKNDYNNITEEKNCQVEQCNVIEDYIMYINYLRNNY